MGFRIFFRLILLVFTFTFLAGCGDDSPSSDPGSTATTDPFEERKLPDELLPQVEEVVAGNNAFAFDLFGGLKESEGNLFFSPFSISTALAMTYAGAAGETADEMAAALHFPADAVDFHPAYGALLTSLDRGSELEGYTLSPANRLWGRSGFPFLQSFLDITGTHYQAGFEELDFAGDPEGSRVTINDWVEANTAGLIKDLLPDSPPVITAATKLVLTNAIYFKGIWQDQFDPAETEERPFYRSDGSEVAVSTMYMAGDFPVAYLDDAILLELPFAGKDLSMLFILPHEVDGLEALEEEVDADQLDLWYDQLEEGEIHIYLPRFRLESSFSLSDAMIALGMELAFTESADFSGITDATALFISALIHKGFVEVNEEGSEAAAATAVVMTDGVPPSFTANHPFLFLIRDNLTECVLFLGRLSDPS